MNNYQFQIHDDQPPVTAQISSLQGSPVLLQIGRLSVYLTLPLAEQVVNELTATLGQIK